MRKSILVAILVMAGTCGAALAQDDAALAQDDAALAQDDAALAQDDAALGQGHGQSVGHTLTCIRCMVDRPTVTRNWFGLGKQMEEMGISVGLSLNQVYQVSLRGSGPAAGGGPGVQTHRHNGRWTGAYDFEVELDLERLLNIPGASFYTHTQGGWSAGLDGSSIGSVLGVSIGGGNSSIVLSEAYWRQSLLEDKLQLKIGKLDMGGGFECQGCPVAFDTNAFAGDDNAQFLNGGLNGNPTIPFPDLGMGVVVYVEPVKGYYASIGVADAQAVASQTGFNTAFHDEDYFFTIVEAGFVPNLPSANGDLQGTYRFGFWYDPQPKENLVNGKNVRDDKGFYLNFDQVVYKENPEADDIQGAGLFFRYGFAHKDVNPIKCFWSIGGQYRGLIPSRDDDVLGLGLATAQLTESADFIKTHETAVETYYNAVVTPGMTFTPSLQWITNPGGVSGVGNAWILGFRLKVTF